MMILNKRAHTLAELLSVIVLLVILFASAIGIFLVTKVVVYDTIAAYNLQRDVNSIVNKIVRGQNEGGVIYGLRSAGSFTIPAATPAASEIDFVGSDSNTRKFFLSGNTIIYESPLQSPNQKVIYTIPANANATLRFWEPAGFMDNETVGIYLSVNQQRQAKTVTGSLTTYVNLRNVQK